MLFGWSAIRRGRHCSIVFDASFLLLTFVLALAIVFFRMLFMLVHKGQFARAADRGNGNEVIFQDRADAGRRLAAKLQAYSGSGTRILALPRGGVPVGFELARALNAPLDMFVVRKLGAPGREELAIGAIASGGVRVLNDETIARLGIEPQVIEALAAREAREVERREQAYRRGLPAHDISGRTVILVDDGLATGASMLAAIHAVRRRAPAWVVAGAPVAPQETCAMLQGYVDELAVVAMPAPFRGVGAWYDDFTQVTDEQVRKLLHDAAQFGRTPL